MDKIIIKLNELEEARNSIERCQKNLKEEIAELNEDEGFKKEMVYMRNKGELQEINKKIQILNDALDILDGIGV